MAHIFRPWFGSFFRFLLRKRVAFSTVFSTETQPRPQIFSADFPSTIDVILPDIPNVLQIWLKQSETEEYFARELKINRETPGSLQ